MKKQFAFLLALSFIFISSFSYSQDRDPMYNLGVDIALPVGDLSNFSSIGIGVTAKGLWGVGNGGSMVGVNLGIMNFCPKEIIVLQSIEYHYMLTSDNILVISM